jgi:hypothetical protein
MDLGSLLEISMWSKKGNAFKKIGASNCDDSLRELTLHGKEVYEAHLPKLLAHGKGVWEPEITDWFTLFLKVTCSEPET